MKKILLVVVVLILLGVVGAVGYYKVKSKLFPTIATKEAETGMFASIKDALSKSLSLQCTFTDNDNRKTTAYIKAGAVRADIIGTDTTKQYNNSSVIVKDKTLYVWDNQTKQGMIVKLEDEQVQSSTGTTAATGWSKEQAPGVGDMMATLEKYKNDCKPAVIADSLFALPTDVKFTDLSKMMQPTGISGMPNQEQLKQLQQQYQAPTGNAGY